MRSAPLICAGLGVTLAFRAGLFNIGAQGQLILGALAAGYVGFTWDLPPGIHLLAALVAGMLGGALWGGIAGVLKARTGAHEVITTIMLNYLAAALLIYCLGKDAFQRPGSDNTQSPPVADSATFPTDRQPAPRRDRRVPGGGPGLVDPQPVARSASRCGRSAPTRTPRAPPA